VIDLFQPGIYLRCPGGNVERPDLHKLAAKWGALNIGTDACVQPADAWDKQRELYRAASFPFFPWRYCHSIAEVENLISTAVLWKSPAIGLNLENVAGEKLDLREVRDVVLDFWVQPHGGQVHMATLPWVQNEQGWGNLDFAVAALEIFPDEQNIWPNGKFDAKILNDCIEHAFAEGLKKVTLMLKTKDYVQSEYGSAVSICRSLYTADDIQVSVPAWEGWAQAQPCTRLQEAPVTDPWYLKPYKKGTAIGPTHLPRVLKPPADGNVMAGDDVTAIKRTVSHAQRWLPWQPSQWDNRYRESFAMGAGGGRVATSGVRGFQRQEGLPQTGIVDDVTYQRMRRALIPVGPREGDHILDAMSIKLIKEAIEEFGPAGKREKVRAAITEFCVQAEGAEEVWHYSQQRPYTGLGLAPEREQWADCSSYVIKTYWAARQKTGILIPDPSKYRYSGYGNTWDDLDGHPRVTSGNYLVGDLAHYDGHVTLCRKAGNAATSVWSSHGAEGGPEALPLYYRGDFRFVCRPPLLPS